jgi:hypothetical protein
MRSSPDSLAATLAAQPSMSLIPIAPFLDFAWNDKDGDAVGGLKEILLPVACSVSKLQS